MLFDRFFLDNLSEQAKGSPRLRMNYDLRDSIDDTSMRMLNALEPGTVIPIHSHLETSEDVICIRGCVEEIIFDNNGVEVERYRLSPESEMMLCHVPMGVYHTCISLESGSVIAEFKNGKYNPETTEDFFNNHLQTH